MSGHEDDTNIKAKQGVEPVIELQQLQQSVRTIAESRRGDTLALLALLRTLEEVHIQVRDELFQPSLPNNRQKLYALLRDIEQEGGWPYIPRMKLKRLMANFEEDVGTLSNSPDFK